MSYPDTTGTSRVITAFFDDRRDAEHAIERLTEAGILRDRIRLVPDEGFGSGERTRIEDGGSIWDMLRDFFLPEEDRHTYAEGLRRGGYLVTVSADESDYDRALDILDDEGTVDLSERESVWRAEGWSGYAGSREATESSSMGSSSFAGDRGEEEVIPVAEEQLRVGKRDVSHGRVKVRSYVVETPVSEDVTLREENVTVERRPVNRSISAGDGLFEDRTIEVEERAEEAVVAKEARVKEELAIRKKVGERTETVSDTVRRTEVEVEDERGRTMPGKTRRTG